MNASGFNPTCLDVLLWARLWTLHWLHCRKTLSPKTLHGGAPDSVPLAAAVAPSVSYGCCSFPTCRGALPWATPDLCGPKSHLAAKKSMTHTFLKGEVPENWHFSKLGNTKHIVYTSRAGSSERTLGGHPSQESRVWCYLFYFQK